MEIEILKNFLTIAREGNMTSASILLHLSQPTLSVQMKHLEEEFGRQLFIRHSRSLSLTEEGMILRERAISILSLVDKTKEEFETMDNLEGGEISIGCAESYLISNLAEKIALLKKKYPLLRFHLLSGDTEIVTQRLDHGLLDFGIIVEPPKLEKYTYVQLPGEDHWGVLMREDDPLAKKDFITFQDLLPKNLICSEQSIEKDLPRWCKEKMEQLYFVGTCSLAYNAARFVEEGIGVYLTFANLIDRGIKTPLCFRPLAPALTNRMHLIWKKHQVFTPIAQKLMELFL